MYVASPKGSVEHISYLFRWVIAVWSLYCLVISSAYAGNLMAFMTTPSFTYPINTLRQVLESGLPWAMVLYGEEEEEMMENSKDPVIKEIWDNKIVEEYAPTPKVRKACMKMEQRKPFQFQYSLKIEGVYKGKSIFIDWKSGLEPAIRVHYSTPAGDPLIHLAPDPVFMPNFPGWGFHKFNPWRERFDDVILRALEAGLVNFWKQGFNSAHLRSLKLFLIYCKLHYQYYMRDLRREKSVRG